MANFKAQIRKEQLRSDGTTNIKIRLTHKGKTRYIRTEFYIKPDQFDEKEGKVNARKHSNATHININLRNIINQFENQLLKHGAQVNQKDIKALLEILKSSKNGEVDFYIHQEEYIRRFELGGQTGSAESHKHTRKWLKEYSPLKTLAFTDINYRFLSGFEAYYKSKGRKPNSIAHHAKNIRTVFNDAINSDIINLDSYPFRKYKIKEEKTPHKNLSRDEMMAILKYEPRSPTEERLLDLFFLSFYLIGINYIDLLLAKPDQLVSGRFHYDRQKTNKNYTIKVQPAAAALINKYQGKEEYLLRFMEDKERTNVKKDRKTPLYKDLTNQTNKVIKRIFENCGLGYRGSTYFMRHTWASIADELEIPESVIGLALGHSSNSVTKRYVYTDIERVDKANAEVIEYLQNALK